MLAENLIAFGRLLRDAGLAVTPEQSRVFGDALARLGLANRRDVKAAGRAVYVRRREEIEAYDSAFDLFWRRSTVEGRAEHPLCSLAFARLRGGKADGRRNTAHPPKTTPPASSPLGLSA
jgi:uncharacterized protein